MNSAENSESDARPTIEINSEDVKWLTEETMSLRESDDSRWKSLRTQLAGIGYPPDGLAVVDAFQDETDALRYICVSDTDTVIDFDVNMFGDPSVRNFSETALGNYRLAPSAHNYLDGAGIVVGEY